MTVSLVVNILMMHLTAPRTLAIVGLIIPTLDQTHAQSGVRSIPYEDYRCVMIHVNHGNKIFIAQHVQ